MVKREKAHEVLPEPVLIGYARVSTQDQDLRMQIDALKRYGVTDDHLYTDKQSGKSTRRKGLEAALLDARPGDVLVVFKLDRLSRSMKDLIALSERLHAEDIELKSLHDPIDTTTPAGKLFFHMMAALAEFERSLIGWRAKAGMEAARQRGARFGPPAKFGDREIRAAIKLAKSGKVRGKYTISAADIGRRFEVSGQLVRDKLMAATGGKRLWPTRQKKPKA